MFATPSAMDALRTARGVYLFDTGTATEVLLLYLRYVLDIETVKGVVGPVRNPGRHYGLPSLSLAEFREKNDGGLLVAPHHANVDAPGMVHVVPGADGRMREAYSRAAADWLRKDRPEVALYGASVQAQALARCLGDSPYRIGVRHFIVSNAADQPDRVSGMPVIGLDDTDAEDREMPVLVATDERWHSEIMNTLAERGFRRVLPCLFETARLLAKPLVEAFFQESGRYRLAESPYAASEFVVSHRDREVAGIESPGRAPHWYLRNVNIADWDRCRETLAGTDLLERQQAVYGRTPMLATLLEGVEPDAAGKIPEIYMAVSQYDVGVKQDIAAVKNVIPIHVGAAACSERLAVVADADGDNISDRNGVYSEMTGVYWLWKNVAPEKYIGLCHYRRHFALSRADLLRLNNSSVDVVVCTMPISTPDNGRYLRDTYLGDGIFAALEETLATLDPEGFEHFQAVRDCPLLISWNMFIMRREWFRRYCSWLFPLTFAIEGRCRENDVAGKRYMGYITEILLATFVARNREHMQTALVDRVMLS